MKKIDIVDIKQAVRDGEMKAYTKDGKIYLKSSEGEVVAIGEASQNTATVKFQIGDIVREIAHFTGSIKLVVDEANQLVKVEPEEDPAEKEVYTLEELVWGIKKTLHMALYTEGCNDEIIQILGKAQNEVWDIIKDKVHPKSFFEPLKS